MRNDRILYGTLQRFGYHQYNSEIPFFHVQTPHGGFTANLQPFPIRNGSNHPVDCYRCFIPISGHLVLSAFLEPHIVEDYDPQSAIVAIRLPMENNTLYSGSLYIGEGEGPQWIPRHM